MKSNFLFLCFIFSSIFTFSQIINSKNIDNQHIRLERNNATILDSSEKKINLKDIYADVVNGKLILMPAHFADSTVYYSLNRKSKMYSTLLWKQMEEAENFYKEKIGKVQEDFEFADLKGTMHRLSDFSAKVVVLNYWFISCKPCREEIPELNDLVDKFVDKDVVFIALANDEADKLIPFLKTTILKYQVAPSTIQIAMKNNIFSYPTNIILDKDRKIVYFEQGYGGSKLNKMTKIIERLLK